MLKYRNTDTHTDTNTYIYVNVIFISSLTFQPLLTFGSVCVCVYIYIPHKHKVMSYVLHFTLCLKRNTSRTFPWHWIFFYNLIFSDLIVFHLLMYDTLLSSVPIVRQLGYIQCVECSYSCIFAYVLVTSLVKNLWST